MRMGLTRSSTSSALLLSDLGCTRRAQSGSAHSGVPARSKMATVVEHLYHELTGVRSGRASPALLESVQVETHGERTQLSHLGTVVARGPHTLAVTVYDKDVRVSGGWGRRVCGWVDAHPAAPDWAAREQNTTAIVKAIADSPLGLYGSAEGGDVIVRVPECERVDGRGVGGL